MVDFKLILGCLEVNFKDLWNENDVKLNEYMNVNAS